MLYAVLIYDLEAEVGNLPPAQLDELINRQNKTNGNWSDQMGEDYATAMALIILQMPNRYLPVYTGKGPGS